MPSPWLSVTAAEYEAHMGPQGADQLAPLADAFMQVYRSLRPARLCLLGCATGNGLEHVDPAVTVRAAGVDLNIQYLAVARQRFRTLGPRLELYCAEALASRFEPGSFDLVHAALLFEHAPPEPLVPRIAEWLAPAGTCSVVLQLPSGEGPVATPAAESLRRVADAMRLVPPGWLADLMARQSLGPTGAWEVPVRNGKRFRIATFRRW